MTRADYDIKQISDTQEDRYGKLRMLTPVNIVFPLTNTLKSGEVSTLSRPPP